MISFYNETAKNSRNFNSSEKQFTVAYKSNISRDLHQVCIGIFWDLEIGLLDDKAKSLLRGEK